jgi:GNAT superfamily N-acetyltransferase
LGSDLSNIDAVYKGSGGIFIVAVDRKVPEKIVGTIAGEIKDKVSFFPGDGLDDDNSSSSKGSRQQRIMELRRMSVDQDCHKRGIGRRLVQALHHQVKPDVAYLTCTNVQYGAHRLYEQAGYVRQQIPGFKLACFGTLQIWGYKKEFSNNHVP